MFPLPYSPQTSIWESSWILDVHISESTFQGRQVRGLHTDSSNSMLFSLHYILNYLLTRIPTVAPAPYHTNSKFPVSSACRTENAQLINPESGSELARSGQ